MIQEGENSHIKIYIILQNIFCLQKQGSLCLGSVELEMAFETVWREIVTAKLRWLGVGLPEAGVRM